jgi:hypothetical protein
MIFKNFQKNKKIMPSKKKKPKYAILAFDH